MATKYFTLSFDDGTVHDRRMIAMLDHFGVKCTFNLNSDRLGTVHTFRQGGLVCDHSEVTAEEVASLYRDHEVAAHGLDHRTFTKLDDAALISEAEDDRKRLAELSGQHVIGCAYPNGPFDEHVKRILKERTGIRYARTVNSTYEFDLPTDWYEWNPTVCLDDDSVFLIAERFLTEPSDADQLFYVWGHSYNFDRLHTWDRLESFLRMMAYRTNLAYVTNREFYEKMQQR